MSTAPSISLPQPTLADRAVIAMPLTATPSRPRRERHRLPVCLSVALVQALIGAPSSAPLPAAAPRRRVSCPSLPALFIPRALCSSSQRTPHKLCSEFRVQSLNSEQSALLLPLRTVLLSCSSPSLHKASRHATIQRLRYLLRPRRLGDGKRRSG